MKTTSGLRLFLYKFFILYQLLLYAFLREKESPTLPILLAAALMRRFVHHMVILTLGQKD